MIMNNEIWKSIPGFEGIYEVSNLGSIKSLKFNKEKILKTYESNGYRKIDLWLDKHKRKYYVHRLVASAFLNLDLNDEISIVNHIDGIKNNNNLNNLEIVTTAENVADGLKRKSNSELSQFITYVDSQKWIAKYKVNEIDIFLGEFTSLKESLIALEAAKLVSNILMEKAL